MQAAGMARKRGGKKNAREKAQEAQKIPLRPDFMLTIGTTPNYPTVSGDSFVRLCDVLRPIFRSMMSGAEPVCAA